MARNPRAKAQRETARIVREQRAAKKEHRTIPRIFPRSFTEGSRRAQADYAYQVVAGNQPMPQPNAPEARQLARMASLASWGKADPMFENMFKQFWYHETQLNPDEYQNDEYEEEEE